MNSALIVQILIRILSTMLMVKGVMNLSEFTSLSVSSETLRNSGNMIYWLYEIIFVTPFLIGIMFWVFSIHLSEAITGIQKSSGEKKRVITNANMAVLTVFCGLLIILIS